MQYSRVKLNIPAVLNRVYLNVLLYRGHLLNLVTPHCRCCHGG